MCPWKNIFSLYLYTYMTIYQHMIILMEPNRRPLLVVVVVVFLLFMLIYLLTLQVASFLGSWQVDRYAVVTYSLFDWITCLPSWNSHVRLTGHQNVLIWHTHTHTHDNVRTYEHINIGEGKSTHARERRYSIRIYVKRWLLQILRDVETR